MARRERVSALPRRREKPSLYSHLATSEALNGEVRSESSESVDRDVDTAEDERELAVEAEVVLEDDGAEVCAKGGISTISRALEAFRRTDN